jgi:hypothetical protein
MTPVRLLHFTYVILFLTLGIFSCKDKAKREEKVFHAAPMDAQSIGGLSFALYNDSSYTILNSGGIGFSSHKGSYTMAGDTITLHNFVKQGLFKRHRLIVIRYDEQDSTYWMWKYSDLFGKPRSLGRTLWQDLKAGDYHMGEGDVYQLDENNRPIRDGYYFNIALDKLKTGKSEK